MKIVRVIEIEGPDEWVEMVLAKSFLQPNVDTAAPYLGEKRTLKEVFRGSEALFDAYMKQRLNHVE